MILSSDDCSIVTLEDTGLVRKLVLKEKSSGLRSHVPPEELVAREVRALKLLNDVEGVVRLVERDSPASFFSRYEIGEQLKNHRGPLPQDYFDELREILRTCHGRGVYRLNRSREDILVTPAQRPVLVDFGNILFDNDSVARIPTLARLAEAHNLLRTGQLRKMYIDRIPYVSLNPYRT